MPPLPTIVNTVGPQHSYVLSFSAANGAGEREHPMKTNYAEIVHPEDEELSDSDADELVSTPPESVTDDPDESDDNTMDTTPNFADSRVDVAKTDQPPSRGAEPSYDPLVEAHDGIWNHSISSPGEPMPVTDQRPKLTSERNEAAISWSVGPHGRAADERKVALSRELEALQQRQKDAKQQSIDDAASSELRNEAQAMANKSEATKFAKKSQRDYQARLDPLSQREAELGEASRTRQREMKVDESATAITGERGLSVAERNARIADDLSRLKAMMRKIRY